jgi:hypothetical protein
MTQALYAHMNNKTIKKKNWYFLFILKNELDFMEEGIPGRGMCKQSHRDGTCRKHL